MLLRPHTVIPDACRRSGMTAFTFPKFQYPQYAPCGRGQQKRVACQHQARVPGSRISPRSLQFWDDDPLVALQFGYISGSVAGPDTTVPGSSPTSGSRPGPASHLPPGSRCGMCHLSVDIRHPQLRYRHRHVRPEHRRIHHGACRQSARDRSSGFFLQGVLARVIPIAYGSSPSSAAICTQGNRLSSTP